MLLSYSKLVWTPSKKFSNFDICSCHNTNWHWTILLHSSCLTPADRTSVNQCFLGLICRLDYEHSSLGKYFVMGLLLICWASWRASFTLLAFSNSFSALLSSWCESCEKIYLLWMSYSAVEHFFPLFAAENQIHSSYRQIIKMINFPPQKIVFFFFAFSQSL